MHTAGRMHTVGRMTRVIVRFRDSISSGEVNVFLISRHLTVCTAERPAVQWQPMIRYTRPAVCIESVLQSTSEYEI